MKEKEEIQKCKDLMKKYNLKMGDLPAFPPRGKKLSDIIECIGLANTVPKS